MTEGFAVGEIVNPDDWDLRVQITSLDPLEAVVIKNTSPTSHVGKFFPIGRTLRFVPTHPGDATWRIDGGEVGMPWHVLGIYQGRRRFAHYR